MSALVLVASALLSLSAQGATSSDADAAAAEAEEAVDRLLETLEEIEDTATLEADPANRYADLAKLKAKRIEEIDATMRLVSADPPLAERLPLPKTILKAELRAMLAHESAWANGYRKERLVTSLIHFSEQSGIVSYLEWSCETGREKEVWASLSSTLDWALTEYPARMFRKVAADKRQALGYGTNRRCSPSALESARATLAMQSAEFWWPIDD